MSEDLLKEMSVEELLAEAEKAINSYVTVSCNPSLKRLAGQRQKDLKLIQKVITDKRAKEIPLK